MADAVNGVELQKGEKGKAVRTALKALAPRGNYETITYGVLLPYMEKEFGFGVADPYFHHIRKQMIEEHKAKLAEKAASKAKPVTPETVQAVAVPDTLLAEPLVAEIPSIEKPFKVPSPAEAGPTAPEPKVQQPKAPEPKPKVAVKEEPRKDEPRTIKLADVPNLVLKAKQLIESLGGKETAKKFIDTL